MKIEARLQERGIVLPQFRPMVSPKVVRYRKAGNLLFIGGRGTGAAIPTWANWAGIWTQIKDMRPDGFRPCTCSPSSSMP